MWWLLRAVLLILSILGVLFALANVIGLSACEVECEDDLFYGTPWYLILGPPLIFFFAVVAESAVAGVRRLRRTRGSVRTAGADRCLSRAHLFALEALLLVAAGAVTWFVSASLGLGAGEDDVRLLVVASVTMVVVRELLDVARHRWR